MKPSRRAAAMLLLSLLAGCAAATGAAGPGAAGDVGVMLAPPGRHCPALAEPEQLPAADRMVDSVALSAAIVALSSRGAGAAGGHALFSLEFDRNGWNSRRDLVAHDLAPALADSLQQLVFAHRREVAAGEPWGARLRVELGAEPSFRVGRRQLCPARPLDPELARGARDGWDVELSPEPYARTRRARIVWARVRVDPLGRVAETRVEAAGSPAEADRVARRVRVASFEPALLDGMPVASWLRVPVFVP